MQGTVDGGSQSKIQWASLGLPVTIRPNGVFRCCWSPVCPKEGGRLNQIAYFQPLDAMGPDRFGRHTKAPLDHTLRGRRPPKSRRTAQMNIDHVHPEARVACVGRTNATCGIPPWVSLKSQNHYTTSIYVTSPTRLEDVDANYDLFFDLLLRVLACRTVLSMMLDGRTCTGLHPHAQPRVPRLSAHVLARICTTTA